MKLCIHFIRICFVRACYITPEVDVVFAKDLYFVEYNQISNQTGVDVETVVGKATEFVLPQSLMFGYLL